ncbi:hypothetical protein QAD02_017477 [Eretmocerus hayati]|uniref:Uncharacterized protein n=1 Tax=Eretmocerus hayati TaxID=131215 RepID=A0ACC2PDP4_9HYME|nr:hypothetical protein QAD02_017477 [Eretmocerus hayati]
MLRAIIFLALAVFAASEKASFQNYKVFRVTPENDQQLELLRQLENLQGYSFWREPSQLSLSSDVMVAPAQLPEFLDLLNSTGLAYETYISDVQRLIDEENPPEDATSTLRAVENFGWNRYHSLEDMYVWMDSLARSYPAKVSLIVGGKTYQGREIRGVKLSFGGARVERPGIFIEGGIHAREWISPATVTYLIDRLVRSENSEVRRLAEAYDWYIIPSFNPDGYVYSQTSNRMWRKTVSKGNYFCKGTDANRNWNYNWNGGGASRNPCAEDYGGSTVFSEIETRTLSQYIKSIGDKLFAYISFHSYSQLLIIPYCDTKKHIGNYNQTYAIGRKALDALSAIHGTRYKIGNAYETVGYFASGSSSDWVKSTFKLPLVYTYELRDTGRNGFILPASQIIPNAEEVLASLIAMFSEASKYGYPKPQQSV